MIFGFLERWMKQLKIRRHNHLGVITYSYQVCDPLEPKCVLVKVQSPKDGGSTSELTREMPTPTVDSL